MVERLVELELLSSLKQPPEYLRTKDQFSGSEYLTLKIFINCCEIREKEKRSYRVIENLKLSEWITSRDAISNMGPYARVSLSCLDLYHVTTNRFILPDLHTVRKLLEIGIVVIFIHDSDVYMKCGAVKWWTALIHRYDIKCVTRQ